MRPPVYVPPRRFDWHRFNDFITKAGICFVCPSSVAIVAIHWFGG